jgi:predicted dehydrogenase
MTSTPLFTPDEADRVSFKVATRGSSSRGPRSGVNRRSRLWYRTMAGFVAAVQGQAEAAPIATGRDGLAVQRILEAAYRPRAT